MTNVLKLDEFADARVGDDLFHAVFRSASIGVKVVDLDTGHLVDANDAFQRMLGYELEELVARPYVEFTHPLDRERETGAHRQIVDRSTDTFHLVKRYVRKDGSPVPVRVTASVVRDETGKARFGVSMVEDISRELEAETALRRSQDTLDVRVRQLEAIAELGRVILGGAGLEDVFELGRGAVSSALGVGRVVVLRGPHGAPAVDVALSCTIEGLDGPDGLLAVYSEGSREFTAEDANFIDSIANLLGSAVRRAEDAELRRQADYELRSTADRFRMLAENAQDVVFRYRLGDEPGYEYVGPACERILGYSADQFYADPELARERLDSRDAEVVAATRRGEVRDPIVLRWDHPSGRTVWIERRVTLIEDGDGGLVALEGILLDVTARVEQEEHRRTLEDRLRQAQKLEALGQLAGGIAHDFNNLLFVVRGCGELALRKLEVDREGAAEDLADIVAAADRGADLTRQLLAFARRQVLNPEVIDLCETVRSMDRLLGRLIGGHVELLTSCPDEPVLVEADRSQLEQVLANLAVNARDAMPGGGRLAIDVSVDGDRAVLEVGDNGAGMDEETLAQAFDPFFTTKGDDGTGLGLATVHGIVTQSGGRLAVDSEPGRGTTFAISLPLSGARPSSAPSSSPQRVDDAETILLVEDNPIVRSIVAAMLQSHGYTVLPAASGTEAVTVAKDAGSIDLVLTDLVMPGMGGRDTAEAVRAMHPGARVLFMSGYTDDAVFRGGGRGPGTGFIQKPFDGAALAASVREALGRTLARD